MLAMEGVCWLCRQLLKIPQQGICSFCIKAYRQCRKFVYNALSRVNITNFLADAALCSHHLGRG